MALLVKEKAATGTIRLRMTHIHEFYKWASSKRYLSRPPFKIAMPGVAPARQRRPGLQLPDVHLPGSVRRQVKPQTQRQFDKVLSKSTRKTSALSSRDELIAEAARYMGLRRSEIAVLRVDQFANLDPSKDVQVIRVQSAKGRGRMDSVLVPRLYVKRIQDFIEAQRATLIERFSALDPKYLDPGLLFLNERGKQRGMGLSGNYIGDTWRRNSVAAGIDSRFHDNRSSFATNAAKAARLADVDARAIVKELLRHRNISTSEIYVEFDEIQADLLMRARVVNDAYHDHLAGRPL